MMHAWQLCIYGVTGFFMSILSGIAGAGGGFIMTPLLIVLGLTPAQAVSSGKFNGLAVTVGSLSGLRNYSGKISRYRVGAIMVLAFIVGLIVPFMIKSFDSRFYRLTLGAILLLMIPLMIYKKVGIKPQTPSLARKSLGGILLTISLFLQGTFSGGLGSLVNIVLMGMLGMTASEANITKRWSQLVLNITIIFGVIGSGLIIWPIVAVGIGASLVGSYIGGRMAVKKGDTFVVNVMLLLMLTSGLVLIFGAL
jgi:uncharacterized membrane protein YfcA